MTELKYDPEFPFVVFIGHVPKARFLQESDASDFSLEFTIAGRVVDTTPKPKIPEDAEFIYYTKSGYDFYVRQLEDGNWKTDGGVLYSYAEILDVLEDAEVTVLVRKEES